MSQTVEPYRKQDLIFNTFLLSDLARLLIMLATKFNFLKKSRLD
jgi:hypothetical protein